MMQKTHTFYLPSGVECEIRNANMADREVFMNPKYLKDHSSLPRFLANIIVRVGNRQEIGYKLPTKTENNFDVMSLLNEDVNCILVNSHVFDSDMDTQYEFDYVFEGYRMKKDKTIVPTKLQDTILVDLSLVFDTMKPYMIPVYEEGVLKKWQVFVPQQASVDALWVDSLNGVDFECVVFDDYYTMLDALKNAVFYDAKCDAYSFSPITLGVGMDLLKKANKETSAQVMELQARKISKVQFADGQEPLHLPIDFNNQDALPRPKTIKFLQDMIRKMEGAVDMVVEFDNKAYLEEKFDMTDLKTYPTYKENLINFRDFLYRTAIH